MEIRFSSSFIKHTYDAQLLELQQGAQVVVETSKGPALATVASYVFRTVAPTGSLKRVLRLANRDDERRAAQNQRREEEAFRFALTRIRERKMPMKLIQVQYMHDGSKAIFYFSADGRVDFRSLVKDLASRFRTRIEMRQIGVRDGARMVGGIGSCGRELCCSTFLEQFAPVSIRMAKDQGLTLNPKKVSGMCGRLMCCLVYEQQIYRKARKRLPRIGKPVRTTMGLGRIKSVDVLRERIAVYLEEEGQVEHFPVSEVIVLSVKEAERFREEGPDVSDEDDVVDPDKRLRDALTGASGGEDEYLWDEGGEGGDDKQPRSRNRSRRRRGGGRSSASRRSGSGSKRSKAPGASGSRSGGGSGGRANDSGKSEGKSGGGASGSRRRRSRRRGGSRRSTNAKGDASSGGNSGGNSGSSEGKGSGRSRRRRPRRSNSNKKGGSDKD